MELISELMDQGYCFWEDNGVLKVFPAPSAELANKIREQKPELLSFLKGDCPNIRELAIQVMEIASEEGKEKLDEALFQDDDAAISSAIRLAYAMVRPNTRFVSWGNKTLKELGS